MTTRLHLDFPTTFEAGVRRRPTGVSRGGPLAWVRAAFSRWRQRRMLSVLDERMLRDLGISRSQAITEASKPFWRA